MRKPTSAVLCESLLSSKPGDPNTNLTRTFTEGLQITGISERMAGILRFLGEDAKIFGSLVI